MSRFRCYALVTLCCAGRGGSETVAGANRQAAGRALFGYDYRAGDMRAQLGGGVWLRLAARTSAISRRPISSASVLRMLATGLPLATCGTSRRR